MGMTMRNGSTRVLKRTLAMALMLVIGVFAAPSAEAGEPGVYALQEFDVGMDKLVGGSKTTYPSSTTNCSSYNDYSMYYLYMAFNSPFTWYFYDRQMSTSSRIWNNANGYIVMGTSLTSYGFSLGSSQDYMSNPRALDQQSSKTPPYSAFLFWGDLLFNTNSGRSISRKTLGTAPNRRLVIEYYKVGIKANGASYTSYCNQTAEGELQGQLIIHESTNILEMHYPDSNSTVEWRPHLKATIGIRGADADATYAVNARVGLDTAPQNNFRYLPQFWSEWDGSSSTSITSSSNWTTWHGSSVAPYSTTNTSATSNSRYMMYIPDVSSLPNKPVMTAGNYYTSGLVVDTGGEFTLSGGTLNLVKKGTGRFENAGTFNIANDAVLAISGDLKNTGTFTNDNQGDSLIILNGTSEYGAQEVQFGPGQFGEIEVQDGGDSNNPTLVKFLDFNPAAFSKLSNEEDTTMQFAGNLDFSNLPAGALSVSGGLGFATGGGDTVVQVGDLKSTGNVVLESTGVADKLTIVGSIEAETMNFLGDGEITITESVKATKRIFYIGNGELNVGTNPADPKDLEFGEQTLLLSNMRSVNVTGSIKSRVGDPVDISISSQADITVGGFNADKGQIQLSAAGDITVPGDVFADRGMIVDNANKISIGAPGTLLSANDAIEFKNVQEVEILGDLQQDGQIALGAPNGVTVNGRADIGVLRIEQMGDLNFNGDLYVGQLDAQSNANVSVGGDLGIAGDVVYAATGNFQVTGNIVLDSGSVEFQGQPLRANGISVVGAGSSVKGDVELSATGLGNVAISVDAAGGLILSDNLNLQLVGGNESVVRVSGSLSSTSGAGAARPLISAGSAGADHARFIFEREAKVNVDGMVLENFGNSFATYGVVIESGATFTQFNNVSILNSQAAKAVVQLNTGTMPAQIDGLEITGTSPASIDANNVANFQVVITPEANSAGGNLFGSSFELDNQGVLVWDGGAVLTFITAKSLPRASRNTEYASPTNFVQAVGGNQPYNFEIDPATRPATLNWLQVNPTTGALSGTPPVSSPIGLQPPVTILVTDATPGGAPVAKAFEIIIDPVPGPALQLLEPTNKVFFEGEEAAKLIWGTGGSPDLDPGNPDYVITHVDGQIPAGLTFTIDGILQGTPAPGTAGPFSLGFTVADTISVTSTQYVNFTIEAGNPRPRFTTLFLPDATGGFTYSFQLGATEGLAPYEFYVASANGDRLTDPVAIAQALPPGMNLTSSGIFYGTPNVVGTHTFYARVQDAFGLDSLQTVQFTLEVKPLDLGPISISGGNSNGNGGCALEGKSNAWLIGLFALLAMAFIVRRRRTIEN